MKIKIGKNKEFRIVEMGGWVWNQSFYKRWDIWRRLIDTYGREYHRQIDERGYEIRVIKGIWVLKWLIGIDRKTGIGFTIYPY